MSEVKEEKESSDLKSLYQQLGEIDSTLRQSRNYLQYIVSGKDEDVSKDTENPQPESISLVMIQDRIHSIGSKASSINRSIKEISGN